jgi:hypothetical protein
VVVLQGRAIVETDAAFAISNDEDGMFSWIRANIEDDETIVSPSITTNLLLASLTPASQYLSEGGFSMAEDEELIDRILRAQAAYGYTEDEAFSRLDVHGEFDGFPVNDATGSTAEKEEELEDYLAFFTFSFEITDQNAFQNRADSWRTRYRGLLLQDDVLGPYPADYLYCGHRERFYVTQPPAPGTYVRLAYQSGDVMLFQIVDQSVAGATEFAGC